MGNGVEEKILLLVSEARRPFSRRTKLSPETRINHDLGLSGKRALTLLDNFSRQFDVDISQLHRDWDFYFKAQPLHLDAISGAGLAFAIVITIVTLLTSVPDGAQKGIIFSILLAYGVFQRHRNLLRLRQDTQPVTIQDLFDSAQTHRWSKPPAPKRYLTLVETQEVDE
jgi:hypothetical protein